ncbi:MAG: hypothetical protein R3349_11830, partial [Geminicoccaceae bacterium]|nr:hypothetical protein [Geminicoccaceae bacterium]
MIGLERPLPPDAQATGQSGRPAMAAPVPSRNVLRLTGMVIAQGRSSLEVEIDGQRWVGQSDRPLPETGGRGARVTLEAPPDDGSGSDRPARLVRADQGRLQAPIDLVLR